MTLYSNIFPLGASFPNTSKLVYLVMGRSEARGSGSLKGGVQDASLRCREEGGGGRGANNNNNNNNNNVGY